MSNKSISRRLLLLVTSALFIATLAMLRKPVSDHFFKRGIEAKSEWRLDRAISFFEWSLRFKGDFNEARFEKALCHQLRGEFLIAGRELDSLMSGEIRDPAFRAGLLNAVGVNRFNSREPDEAIEAHTRSLELARELGDRRLEAEALIDLSRALYHLKGQSDMALAHLDKALRIGRELGDELIEAHALRNIGVIYWWFKGELDRPLAEHYEPALEIYRRKNYLHGVAIMLSNISLVHTLKGDLFQFLKYQNESIEIKNRTGDLAGLCDSYSFIGGAYEGMGNYRKAHEYYVKGLEISRRIGYRLIESDAESLLARVYWRMGKYDDLIGLLNPILARESGNPFQAKRYHGELGHCYLLKGELDAARHHLERVLEIERSMGEPDVRSTIVATLFLGEAYMRLGDYEKAAGLFDEARRMGTKQGDQLRSLENYILLAEFLGLQGRRADAIKYLIEAAEMQSQRFSSLGTILVSGQSKRLYDRIFTLLLETPAGSSALEEDLAFRFLEQLRYSSFRDLVLQLSEKKPNSRPLQSEERRALLQIENASSELKRRDDSRLRERLRRAYSEYEDMVMKSELSHTSYRLVREAQPVELKRLQRALDSETAIVEYLFAADKVFSLVITESSIRAIALSVTRPNLSAKVKLFRSLIFDHSRNGNSNGLDNISQAKERPDWQPVAEDLYRSLIEPLERSNALTGIRRLGFVPIGFLHDLPFAAMARESEGGLRFLVEDYSVFRTPSATSLTHSLEQTEGRESSQKKSMLSFGRNESDEPELLPLGFAVEEAREVARLFGGDALVEGEASETALNRLAPDFQYIHLATHAVSEPNMPLLSHLELESTREDDGNLIVREILDLGLEAQLVTLGACQTGQSFSSSGNEMSEVDRIGLIEAFLHAGARSVLASLLSISDRPTTEFMKGFYGNLQSKGKAEALAETQRAMIRGELTYMEGDQQRDLSHPRYWATFILVGDYH